MQMRLPTATQTQRGMPLVQESAEVEMQAIICTRCGAPMQNVTHCDYCKTNFTRSEKDYMLPGSTLKSGPTLTVSCYSRMVSTAYGVMPRAVGSRHTCPLCEQVMTYENGIAECSGCNIRIQL